MRIIYLLIVLFLIIHGIALGQTSSLGNYEIYTKETGTSSIGYLNLNLNFPPETNIGEVSYKGFIYSYNYLLANLTSVPLSSNDQLRFYLEGSLRIGFAAGRNDLLLQNQYYNINMNTYYIGVLDFFSIDFAQEYTYVLDHGDALTVKFAVNFINIGGTAAVLKRGKFKESTIIEANLIPLGFKPSLYYDFGRSGLGLSVYINTTNFLTYSLTPEMLFNSKSDLRSGAIFKKYAFQIIFVF